MSCAIYDTMLFDKDVTLQAILYILDKMGGSCDIHKICKILYFADQHHLSLYSRSITGDSYIAMQYGPVPSRVDDILKAVRGDSYFSKPEYTEDLSSAFAFVNKYIIKAKKRPDLDYLSDTDIECLDKSVALCRNKSFGELTEFSHGMAWTSTQRDRTMSVKDILREVGDEEAYAEYVDQKQNWWRAFSVGGLA